MRRHIPAIPIIVALAAWFIYVAVQHSSGTVNDKVYGLANMVVAVVVAAIALLSAVVAAFTRRKVFRNYLPFIGVLAAGIAPVSLAAENYRINRTAKYLESVYTSLAGQGPPFPTQIPAPPTWAISHGYWVSADLQTFEVYYHDGSDSFTLAYPSAAWDWRGNKYAGPE